MHSKQRGDDDDDDDDVYDDYGDDDSVYDDDGDDGDDDDSDDDLNSGDECTRNKVAIGDGKAATGWKQNTEFLQKYKYTNASSKK